MKDNKRNILLIGLVVLLIVVAGVQTLQIKALEEKISPGNIKTGSAASSQTTQAPTVRPASTPTMVGGC